MSYEGDDEGAKLRDALTDYIEGNTKAQTIKTKSKSGSKERLKAIAKSYSGVSDPFKDRLCECLSALETRRNELQVQLHSNSFAPGIKATLEEVKREERNYSFLYDLYFRHEQLNEIRVERGIKKTDFFGETLFDCIERLGKTIALETVRINQHKGTPSEYQQRELERLKQKEELYQAIYSIYREYSPTPKPRFS